MSYIVEQSKDLLAKSSNSTNGPDLMPGISGGSGMFGYGSDGSISNLPASEQPNGGFSFKKVNHYNQKPKSNDGTDIVITIVNQATAY